MFLTRLICLGCLVIEAYNGPVAFLQFLQTFMSRFTFHLKPKTNLCFSSQKIGAKKCNMLRFKRPKTKNLAKISKMPLVVWFLASYRGNCYQKSFMPRLKIELRPYPLLRSQNREPFHYSSSSLRACTPLSLLSLSGTTTTASTNSSMATALWWWITLRFATSLFFVHGSSFNEGGDQRRLFCNMVVRRGGLVSRRIQPIIWVL